MHFTGVGCVYYSVSYAAVFAESCELLVDYYNGTIAAFVFFPLPLSAEADV